jgi:hypothetical protein
MRQVRPAGGGTAAEQPHSEAVPQMPRSPGRQVVGIGHRGRCRGLIRPPAHSVVI